MSKTTHVSQETSRARPKVRALLAAASVLGLGTIVTLAAWNDSEFATGTFTAGTFDMEGASTDIAGAPVFSEHDTLGTAAELQFVLDATNLSPGASVSAPYAVRLTTGTTSDATVDLTAAGSTGVVTNLTYSIAEANSWGCSDLGTDLVPAGTPIDSVPASTGFTLTQGATGSPGAPQYLCFTVTAGPELDSGQTGTMSWQFLATSTTP